MSIFYFSLLLALTPALITLLILCPRGGPRGSIYLHILGITIPLIVKSGPSKGPSKLSALIWEPVTSLNEKCCDRYKRTKTNHSSACRKRMSGTRNVVKWECGA